LKNGLEFIVAIAIFSYQEKLFVIAASPLALLLFLISFSFLQVVP